MHEHDWKAAGDIYVARISAHWWTPCNHYLHYPCSSSNKWSIKMKTSFVLPIWQNGCSMSSPHLRSRRIPAAVLYPSKTPFSLNKPTPVIICRRGAYRRDILRIVKRRKKNDITTDENGQLKKCPLLRGAPDGRTVVAMSGSGSCSLAFLFFPRFCQGSFIRIGMLLFLE